MPNTVESADAASGVGTSYTLRVGQVAQGTITSGDASDWYKVELVAGQQYTFAMVGTGLSTVNLDNSLLRLSNASGAVLRTNDDGGPGAFSSITFTATSTGTYYLQADTAYSGATGRYAVSVTTGDKAYFDETMGAGTLLRPELSWSAPGTGAEVTWAISSSNPDQTDAQGFSTPFIRLSAAQIAAVKSCLAEFSSVADITFTQVNPGGTSNNATMLFSAYESTTDGAGAYAYYPGSSDPDHPHGNVSLNNDSVSITSLPRGDYGFFAILHEIGHAVGLDHPGDYNAAPDVSIEYDTHAQFIQDSQQYTVMSYFDESNTTSSFNSYADGLLLYDIYALQQLYGANMTTRTGNSVYGFNANTGSVFDFTKNTDPVFCIWDAGGTDTIDASGFSQSQVIDLIAGKFSNIGGFSRNVSVAFGAVIENAVGGSGNDTLRGNSSNNILDGREGADKLTGGAGNDTYVLANGTDTVSDASGTDLITSTISRSLVNYSAIENLMLRGSANINGTGNELDNVLTGNSGGNTLSGGSGNDTLNGGTGADTLSGGSGNDTYVLGAESDQVIDSYGGDMITSTITRSLANFAAIEGLTLLGSSAINGTGNDLNNTLTGNSGRNILSGGAGNDTIDGNFGNDTLTGGAGSDSFVFDAKLDGASNIDTISDFSVAADTIRFENSIFTKLTTLGKLLPSLFEVNNDGVSHQSNNYIIYDSDDGTLYYDSNGSVSGGRLLVAHLATNLSLTYEDFLIV
jgi:serralysin